MVNMEKKCKNCGEIKLLSQFFKDKGLKDGHASTCKICKQAKIYAWRESNKDKYNAGAKKWRDNNKDKEYGHEIKRRYGVNLEQYNKMLVSQNFKCAICGKAHNDKIKRGRLYVDHDHKTGKVRALLCAFHNSMLGYAKDDINILDKAIQYLKKHKAV